MSVTDISSVRQKHDAVQEIVTTLQELEMKAHRAGLHVSAHAINNAKNAVGWEAVGNIEAAGLASRGKRVGEK